MVCDFSKAGANSTLVINIYPSSNIIVEDEKLQLSTKVMIVLSWTMALYLFAVLLTFSPSDPGWNNSNPSESIANLGGVVGAYIADIGFYFLGYAVLFIPVSIAQFGLFYTRRLSRFPTGQIILPIMFIVCSAFVLVSLCGLENLFAYYATNFHHGGIVGYEINELMRQYVMEPVTVLTFVALFMTGTAAMKLLPWVGIINTTGRAVNSLFGALFSTTILGELKRSGIAIKPEFQSKPTAPASGASAKSDDFKPTPKLDPKSNIQRGKTSGTASRKDPVIVPIRKSDPRGKPASTSSVTDTSSPDSISTRIPAHGNSPKTAPRKFPQTSVLDKSNRFEHAYTQEEVNEMAQKIEAMLKQFNVSVQVRNAHPGPVITQFEVEPAAGIKASQIINLAADLARTLTVQSVRVVDNIPGSSHVGIEVPNKEREMVRLVDGLESDEYKSSTHPLTVVLGKDIRGNTVVSNLSVMPHLLIAGTTGAGKSVCLNAILLSFLFKSTPKDLRLIMIDPKMLEFSVYEGIPHLLVPVITDMTMTERALSWCISEMERRFALMAKLGVRNMQNFNESLRNSKEPIPDPTASDPDNAEPLEPMPYIVFIIDELADLIMVMGKKAEELIIRIAQRARAAGIHMIVATQRPSTDVIRGVLKANIPTRIGFKVASNADSRTILDQTGAENLLGAGDMLFIPPGSASAMRVHGAFVSDEEVKRVVESVKTAGEPNYDESATAALSELEQLDMLRDNLGSNGEDDELYNHAIDFVARSRRASISSIQRHLRIGYNRAARIIESMEEAGVVSPVLAGGKREVLVAPPEN